MARVSSALAALALLAGALRVEAANTTDATGSNETHEPATTTTAAATDETNGTATTTAAGTPISGARRRAPVTFLLVLLALMTILVPAGASNESNATALANETSKTATTTLAIATTTAIDETNGTATTTLAGQPISGARPSGVSSTVGLAMVALSFRWWVARVA